MTKVTVYNQTGDKVKDLELNPEIFNVAIKPDVIQQAVVIQQANARVNLAHTKDRSAVSGGGKKPWKQKGTGRARHGSIRSPLWRGGGVTFGPTKDRNFALKINKKAKRKALLMGLSDKAANSNLVLIDQLTLEPVKTKKFFEVLQNLQLRRKSGTAKPAAKKSTAKTKTADAANKPSLKEGSILVILPKKDENIRRAARNIAKVETILADSLNIVDVVKYQKLLMPIDALTVIEKTFIPSTAKAVRGKK